LLESSVCFFCWILIIFTSILFFSLLLVGGYHRLFYIFVMPVSSMCMQTSNFIDAAFSILLQVKAFFFFSSLIFFICVVWFGCPALCPVFVLYYFAIVPGRRYSAFGVFPTDSVSCFCSVSLKSLLLQLDIAFLFG
jgi:hypothetical protein